MPAALSLLNSVFLLEHADHHADGTLPLHVLIDGVVGVRRADVEFWGPRCSDVNLLAQAEPQLRAPQVFQCSQDFDIVVLDEVGARAGCVREDAACEHAGVAGVIFHCASHPPLLHGSDARRQEATCEGDSSARSACLGWS
ncbi:hypothetical protein SNK04_014280 [Fusarium graminearum]